MLTRDEAREFYDRFGHEQDWQRCHEGRAWPRPVVRFGRLTHPSRPDEGGRGMQCQNPHCRFQERYGSPAELDDGVTECPHCGRRVAEEPPGSRDRVEFVPLATVATFHEASAAHLARGCLEAEGILARVVDEHLGAMHFLNATPGGVRLKVLPEQLGLAREILGSDHSGAFGPGMEVEDEEDAPRCPDCGSASPVEQPPFRLLRILSILFGPAATVRSRRSRCASCGQTRK